MAPPNGHRPVATDLRGATTVGIQWPGRLQWLFAAHPHGDQFAQPTEFQSNAAISAPRNAAGRPALRNFEEIRKTTASSPAAKGYAAAGEATSANG